ncbi:hypothetical protein TRE132_44000 [Pseudomonas chlororaphis subsp. aurantiaca]|nr:hypothetical protein TRE132_44000 [Pseudomonas chlororaphis subsp. aurantiaca]
MRQVLLIIDVQPTFNPPDWLVDGINALLGQLPSVATVERHDESRTPFVRQLGWQPAADDHSLVAADRIFIKHGYAPTPETIAYLRNLAPNACWSAASRPTPACSPPASPCSTPACNRP